MLTIYAVPVSVYNAKLRILLRHKGVEFTELPPPGGYGSAEYKALIPSGNLPAMIHGDLVLADSEAIAEYIEDAFPDVPMLPANMQLRAKAREKSRMHDTRLEPAVRAIYPQVAYATRNVDAVNAGGAAISKHLASLALLLSTDPLDRDTLWMCDCGFAVTFAWIKAFETAIDLPITWPEAVLAYDARLRGFPEVAKELIAYKPAMDAYLEKAKPSV
ncbi:glutathione S-transferase N-terminal domain-containing protein [Loktanella sp. F6476L]|uniref:glutathione S-transferase family protein n=1 Tax=Loktanella sp. F6476L TaxID=2926405 RepID=UPI001FF35D87|nr:glutathione S-transferase N-terminal domain-containing protein [Loktanella sp. F6476L]MCK0119206.1 glutathione S-transferase N-terminal domain-containing protein [Loktanella sp. F6476L]